MILLPSTTPNSTTLLPTSPPNDLLLVDWRDATLAPSHKGEANIKGGNDIQGGKHAKLGKGRLKSNRRRDWARWRPRSAAAGTRRSTRERADTHGSTTNVRMVPETIFFSRTEDAVDYPLTMESRPTPAAIVSISAWFSSKSCTHQRDQALHFQIHLVANQCGKAGIGKYGKAVVMSEFAQLEGNTSTRIDQRRVAHITPHVNAALLVAL
jgi:hypothetical protein